MNTRMTIDQLEKMKTHDLADLLSNVVVLLRRMPNVECGSLTQQLPAPLPAEEQPAPVRSQPTGGYNRTSLTKMKVGELKALAKDLNVLFHSSDRKNDLIEKILARPAHGHSEQHAILDL